MDRLVADNWKRVFVESYPALKLHRTVQHEHLICFERKGDLTMTKLFFTLVGIID